MRWAITGTPGTGKTTATNLLAVDRPIVHLNEVVADRGFTTGVDDDRDTQIADLDALAAWLGEQPDDVIVESHIAHLLAVDRVVVLRCHPDELRERLRDREESAAAAAGIEENADSEALDLILSEAVDRHGTEVIFEIDTTGRSPDEVAGDIERAIAGEMSPCVGTVSFLEES